jgi:hypothetical protein
MLLAVESLQMSDGNDRATGKVWVECFMNDIGKNTNIAARGDSDIASVLCENWFNHCDAQNMSLTTPSIDSILTHRRQKFSQR